MIRRAYHDSKTCIWLMHDMFSSNREGRNDSGNTFPEPGFLLSELPVDGALGADGGG